MPSRRKRGLVAIIPVLSCAAALLIWKAGAQAIGAPIILPPPETVLAECARLFVTPKFFLSVGMTGLRCLSAFGLTLALGTSIGVLSGLFPAFKAFLSPYMAVIRSTPVLAVIVLLLIWFPQDVVPVVAALLMAVPVLSASLAEGIRSLDGNLDEMARVFRIPLAKRFLKLTLPGISPFALSGASAGLSLIWKVIVAGEVLSQPRFAIGTGLHYAKITLETAQALAWTVATIILCALTDLAFSAFARRLRSSRYGAAS
jgi:NitT/TauT family transport system permease protein